MKRASMVYALVLTAAAVSSQAMPPALQSSGPDTHGLRIGIAAIGTGHLPPAGGEFRVSLENVGESDFVVNLGHMLANGKIMFPGAIRLMVTDSLGQTRELQFWDRRYPGVAGRVDDFTVALRSGSVYVLRISLDHYYSPATKEFVLNLADGRYRIAARFDGKGAQTTNVGMEGAALLNFWTGTARSNAIDFEVSSLQSPPGDGFEVDLWPGEGRPVFEAVASRLRLHELPSASSRVIDTLHVRPGQRLLSTTGGIER